MPQPEFEIYKDESGRFRWRLRAPDRDIITFSHGAYQTKEACEHALLWVRRSVRRARKTELTRRPKKGKVLRRQRVFVVLGRNSRARNAINRFLVSVGLVPLFFEEARKLTRSTNPFIEKVVRKAFSVTQATIVLMTPDDLGLLREHLTNRRDSAQETQLVPRARQNVVYEAGMSMALRANRTVLVTLGDPCGFSDISGRHLVELNNTQEMRRRLAASLKTAKCKINLSGLDWLTRDSGGDFAGALRTPWNRRKELRQLLRRERNRLAQIPLTYT